MKKKDYDIIEKLEFLNISQYSLKGVFKRSPQQIWWAINSNKYPSLKEKIRNYLDKRIINKKQ